MTAQRADRRYPSPYGLGSATTGALGRSDGHQWGELTSAAGENRWPPLGRNQ